MNDISQTIEYAQYSWNPLTGCHHGCDYCYAKRIATRFGGGYPADWAEYKDGVGIARPRWPFPYGFRPTFYPHRLAEPSKVRKPSRIFVGDMADVPGKWWPDWVLTEVNKAMDAAPWHTYLLLTKHPQGYERLCAWGHMPQNKWIGATQTSGEQTDWTYQNSRILVEMPAAVHWLSVEPILGSTEGMSLDDIEWIVIGARTGPRVEPPDRVWVEGLVRRCQERGIPIWLKESLRNTGVWASELIQQLPCVAQVLND